MDLVQRIATELQIDESKAERGIGTILAVLRVTLPRDTFDRVKEALPLSERWMGRALMSGGRTGELPALGSPSALRVALTAAGYNPQEVSRLARIVHEELRPVVGEAADRLLVPAPGPQS